MTHKQRIIEKHKYNPSKNAERRSKLDGNSGVSKTYKKKGDIILTSTGRVEATKSGWLV